MLVTYSNGDILSGTPNNLKLYYSMTGFNRLVMLLGRYLRRIKCLTIVLSQFSEGLLIELDETPIHAAQFLCNHETTFDGEADLVLEPPYSGGPDRPGG